MGSPTRNIKLLKTHKRQKSISHSCVEYPPTRSATRSSSSGRITTDYQIPWSTTSRLEPRLSAPVINMFLTKSTSLLQLTTYQSACNSTNCRATLSSVSRSVHGKYDVLQLLGLAIPQPPPHKHTTSTRRNFLSRVMYKEGAFGIEFVMSLIVTFPLYFYILMCELLPFLPIFDHFYT